MMVRERRSRLNPLPPNNPKQVSSGPQISNRPSRYIYVRESFLGTVVAILGLLAYMNRPSFVKARAEMNAAVDVTQVREWSFPSQSTGRVDTQVFPNCKIQTRGTSVCGSSNALVFLAQKKHSTYSRDSLGLLVKALKLVRDNYLSIDNHHHGTADIFLFHTGDFKASDLVYLDDCREIAIPDQGNLPHGQHQQYGLLVFARVAPKQMERQ